MGFTPQAFGKYYLVDKIATGGMAEIFKAKTYSHGGFENLLVIKRILPHIGENLEFVEMFIDEAKVSVALQHANIVRVFDFGKIADNYFIAMECVDGKDIRNLLRKLAKRRQWLRPAYAAFLAHEVCKALHYAHTRTDLDGEPYHIVHRDISPSNVILSYDGDVKVADFGIAKARSNAYQTRDGVLKGKYEYMSPEQAAGQEVDHRSDLFAVGIILHECLSGRRLFKGDSDQATLARIRAAEVVRPSRLNRAVPEILDEICLRALARSPDQRYQDAQQMADDLRRYLHPLSPDELRVEVGRFMRELFAEEITQERERLQAHSEVALRLRDAAESWDGADSTMGTLPRPATRTLLPLALGLLAVVAGVFLITTSTVAWMVYSQLEARPPPLPAPRLEAPTTGRIDILVLPEARITVDGQDHGPRDQLALTDLAPGTYIVRLEAEGFLPVEEVVTLHAGQERRIRHTLKPIPEPEVLPDPTPAPAPARRPRPVPAPVVTPAPEETPPPEPDAEPEPPAPGLLTVTVVGGGWAHVSIDGRRLDKTAPLKDWPLQPGTYEIRLENPALGIDQVERITVEPGAEIELAARVQ